MYTKLVAYIRRRNIRKRHLLYGLFLTVLLLVSSLSLISLSPYSSRGPNHFLRAKVFSIQNEQSATLGSVQNVWVRLLDGPQKGTVIPVQRTPFGDKASKRLPVGSEVVLIQESQSGQYGFVSRWYMPGVGTLFIMLLVLVVAIGAWRGIMSIFGLAISIAILATFVVPRIVQGSDAFVTCIIGAVLITLVSLFVAHGLTKRTTVAFIASVVTLAIVVGLTALASYVTGTSEIITEDSVGIFYATHPIDIAGLLTGGVVIASLGTLFDITTGQAATVDEIHKTDHTQAIGRLFWKGMSVGREHIAALINTLALVYVGVALPSIVTTVILNHQSHRQAPLLIYLNTETLAEEVVRTCVPSIAMLLALPVTTYLAAYVLPRWTPAVDQKIKRWFAELW